MPIIVRRRRNEADRQALNAWLRAPGHADALVDFDALVRDPTAPDHLLPAYDVGDHIHPSVAGYQAMANLIPLAFFGKPPSHAAHRPAHRGKTKMRKLFLAAALCLFAAPAAAQMKIAITFDDLPSHARLPPDTSRIEVATKIIAALRDARTPPVYGFVNGPAAGGRSTVGAGAGAVARGRFPARQPHLFAHEFERQHARRLERRHGEGRGRHRAADDGQDWHWLRYPYLAEGETLAKHLAARAFLADGGYRIAAVTMSFDDYLWNDPYARCVARHDAATIATMETAYLAAAEASLAYYHDLSTQLYGHDIPMCS